MVRQLNHRLKNQSLDNVVGHMNAASTKLCIVYLIVEVLVVNALREEPHYSHFNLEEAIAFAQRVGAKKTYFTHISHHLGFHDQVALKLPENIYLAYDSLTISI
jgi:phosphoribosyl 1,2-cyclic phosphodiesterase